MGSYLFKQGDPVTKYFVIFKGEYRVIKSIEIPQEPIMRHDIK